MGTINDVKAFWQAKVMLLFIFRVLIEGMVDKYQPPKHIYILRYTIYLLQQNVTLLISAGVLVLGKFKSTCTLLMYLVPTLPWELAKLRTYNSYYLTFRVLETSLLISSLRRREALPVHLVVVHHTPDHMSLGLDRRPCPTTNRDTQQEVYLRLTVNKM